MKNHKIQSSETVTVFGHPKVVSDRVDPNDQRVYLKNILIYFYIPPKLQNFTTQA